MRLTDNTILITGGGTGIGRGLARALHARGNKVIIAGLDLGELNVVVAENPGMVAVKLDIRDAGEIQRVAKGLISQYPKLNVLMNNAGVMHRDDVAGPIDDGKVSDQINTNLIGSIRLTAALVEHLKSRPEAAIIYTSSTLGFIPMALFAVYSATKAALHSYAMSQRSTEGYVREGAGDQPAVRRHEARWWKSGRSARDDGRRFRGRTVADPRQ